MERRIARIRKEKGLTQGQLSMLANVPRICISRYETGKYHPNLKNISKLAYALGTTVDELIAEDNDEVPNNRANC